MQVLYPYGKRPKFIRIKKVNIREREVEVVCGKESMVLRNDQEVHVIKQ